MTRLSSDTFIDFWLCPIDAPRPFSRGEDEGEGLRRAQFHMAQPSPYPLSSEGRGDNSRYRNALQNSCSFVSHSWLSVTCRKTPRSHRKRNPHPPAAIRRKSVV